jgi:hypothetical protein
MYLDGRAFMVVLRNLAVVPSFHFPPFSHSPHELLSLSCCCPFILTRDGRVANRRSHRVAIPGRIQDLGRDTRIRGTTGTSCRKRCGLPLDYSEPRTTTPNSSPNTQSDHFQRCIRHIEESGALHCLLQRSHVFAQSTDVVDRASNRMYVRRPTPNEEEESNPRAAGGILGSSKDAVHGVGKCNIVSKALISATNMQP